MMKKIIPFILLIVWIGSSGYSRDLKDFVSADELKSIDELKSMKNVSEVNIGGLSGEAVNYYLSPNSILIQYNLGPLKITQGFDGKTAWMTDQNGQSMELTGHDKTSIINAAYMAGSSYLFDDRMTGETKYLKDSLVNDVDYGIFMIYPDGGDSMMILINVSTGRLEMQKEWIDELYTWSYMSDFREIEDMEMPFSIETIASIPTLNSSTKVLAVEVNAEVDPSIFSIPNDQAEDFVFPYEDFVVTDFDYYNGHIYVDVSINGEKEAKFILDSGAGTNILSKSFAESVGLNLSGDIPSKGVAGYAQASLATIDSMKINGVTLLNQMAGVIDLGPIQNSPNIEFGGILGYDFISRFPLKIDFANQKLTIYNPDKFVPPQTDGIDFEFYLKTPTIIANYCGIDGRFIVDFGNSLALLLHGPFVRENDLEKTLTDTLDIANSIGGVGGSTKARAALGGRFVMGNLEFEQTPVLIAESEGGLMESTEIDGNIGNLLLQEKVIIVDYSNKKLYILPSD